MQHEDDSQYQHQRHRPKWYLPVLLTALGALTLFLIGEIIMSHHSRGQLQAELKIRGEQITAIHRRLGTERRIRRQTDEQLRAMLMFFLREHQKQTFESEAIPYQLTQPHTK